MYSSCPTRKKWTEKVAVNLLNKACRDQRVSKHFDGLFNNVKIKIFNFGFTTHSKIAETVEVIEIISKVKFHEGDKESSPSTK
ncbi:hypothetical protein CQA01_18600 [Cyclobacterium qasimii]|uniref:Uncharacterized protein n=1 Tax=Cyclobacterium qasimii TaxID=1350429 RepID=A0A512CAU1_9BACT|nr:hypothetical protein CQA01_18600 [Cyclobacterium qasimii]